LRRGRDAPSISFLRVATVSKGLHVKRRVGPFTSPRFPRWNRVRCGCAEVSSGRSRTFTMIFASVTAIACVGALGGDLSVVFNVREERARLWCARCIAK